jgi:hypothetical protein
VPGSGIKRQYSNGSGPNPKVSRNNNGYGHSVEKEVNYAQARSVKAALFRPTHRRVANNGYPLRRYDYGYEESRSDHLCNCFFGRRFISGRIGRWRTLGCLRNGRSIPRTVSPCIANRCNHPGVAPCRNGCRHIGSSRVDLARMVTGLPPTRMVRGSLRGSKPGPQSGHTKRG